MVKVCLRHACALLGDGKVVLTSCSRALQTQLPRHRHFSYTRPVLLSVTGTDVSYAHGSTVTVTAQLTALTNSARPAPMQCITLHGPGSAVCGRMARALY